jgi:hypothetical protein
MCTNRRAHASVCGWPCAWHMRCRCVRATCPGARAPLRVQGARCCNPRISAPREASKLVTQCSLRTDGQPPLPSSLTPPLSRAAQGTQTCAQTRQQAARHLSGGRRPQPPPRPRQTTACGALHCCRHRRQSKRHQRSHPQSLSTAGHAAACQQARRHQHQEDQAVVGWLGVRL